MRIILKNFRSHLDYEIEFKDGIVHFIKGDSGTGKSTIFQAIIWALYGKEQLVHNHDHPTQKMWVILHLDGMIIHRQKYPGAVIVTFGNVEYKNDIAEEMIVQQFGEQDVWMASSYLMQSKPHPFIEFSRKNRMRLLNHIAFGGEDPTPRLAKLDEKIKDCEKVLAIAQPVYDHNLGAFNTMVKEQNINMKDRLDAESHLKDVETLNISITSSQAAIKELKINVARYQTLKDQHQSLSARLGSIMKVHPNLSPQILEGLKVQRENYLTDVKNLTIAQDSLRKFEALTLKTGLDPPIFRATDVDAAKHQEAQFQENRSLAEKLRIPYTAEAINREILKLENSLNYQWVYPLHRQAQQLHARIEDYKRQNSQLLFADVGFMTMNFNSQWMLDAHAAAHRLDGIIQSLQATNLALSPKELTVNDLQVAEKTLEMQWVFKAQRSRDQLLQELETKKLILKEYQDVTPENFEDLKRVLASQSLYQQIDQRESLEKQLDCLEIDSTVTLQTLTSLQQELVDLERTKNLEHCPSCQIALSVVRGKITKFAGHVYNETEAEELRSKIQRSSKIVENQKVALYLHQQINGLKVDVPLGMYRIVNLSDHQAKIDRCEKFFALEKEIRRLEGEISKINIPVVDFPEIVDLRGHEMYIETCKKYLQNLRSLDLYQQELSKINLPTIPPGVFKIPDLRVYQREIDQGHQFLQNLESIKVLEVEASKNALPAIPEGVTELLEIEPMKRRLNDLKKMVMVSPLATSVETMEQAIEWHQLNELMIKGEIRKTLSAPRIVEVQLETIDGVASALAQKSLLEQQIKETSDLIETFVGTSFEMSELQNQQSVLKEMMALKISMEMKIEASKRADIAAEKFKVLMERSDQLDDLKQRLVDLQEFKALCKEAESAALMKLLESLNVFINSVAYKLFDDPIDIRISTMAVQKKKVRGAVVEKQHAHIGIHYKGGNFPDAKLLSGGEYERVSLLLSLAFNRVVGSNLLILDEATGSLDGERKDDCFETIRQCMANKTIIMTNHEGHVGYYDNIVELTR